MIKISIFVILLHGSILGWVNCDAECYTTTRGTCLDNAMETIPRADRGKYCSWAPKFAYCEKTAAIECGMGFVAESARMLTVIQEICVKGSKLNRDLEKYLPLFGDPIADRSECYKQVIPNYSNFTEGISEKVECLYIDEMKDCHYKIIKNRCGSEAYEFFKFMRDPEFALRKKTCKEVLGVRMREK